MNAESGQPLSNVCAYLYPVGPEISAAASCSGADGRVVLQDVAAGSYQLAFADTTGLRATEWYGGAHTRAGAASITLTDFQQLLDADVEMDLTGAITGSVSNNDGPMAGVCVYADDSAGNYSGVGGCTDVTGSYTLAGLAPGVYKLGFYPPGQPTPTNQWFSGKSDEATADPVTVTSGETTTGINQLMN